MNAAVDNLGPSDLARIHLQLHLRRMNRILGAAVSQQKRIASALKHHDVTPLCVSDEQVDQLLGQVGSQLCFLPAKEPAVDVFSEEESQLEMRLRLCAETKRWALPLDEMTSQLKLTDFERDVVLLCLTPELHRGYGRILAFIHDDLNCQVPTLGLICSLLAHSEDEWLRHRTTLSVHGNLRRLGLLLTRDEINSEQQLTCRVATGVLDRLREARVSSSGSSSGWRDQFYDPEEVSLDQVDLESFAQRGQLKAAADALRQGKLNLLAIWGESAAGVDSAVTAVASESGRPLRRLSLKSAAIRDALARATYLNAIVWIESDRLLDDDNRQLADDVLSQLLPSSVPLIVSGQDPWRPTALLARRNYAELRLLVPDEEQRISTWRQVIPELSQTDAASLSHRFRLTPQALVAAKRTYRMRAQLESNGACSSVVDRLEEACRVVAQSRGCRFSKPVTPERGPEDLVLPPAIHRQVLEVASFYRALSRVNEQWGFGRLATGAGGIKALFAGDSGTGKTLAAEVIAGQIGLPLLKIDLSQLVSKWVGETEKNIDAAFCEAEASHAMLFFDEADTLFGKRGQIQRGSDRYANLEVGYLLQRLELFRGLVVLASNLKDEIDEAFLRRFQVVLHFPRPQEQERLRLWQMAFPPSAPLDGSVDLTSLVHLDMTGAAIFNACHTAGLLAANEGSDVIGHEHIVEGIARQFHRESRIIGPSELRRFSQQSPIPIGR